MFLRCGITSLLNYFFHHWTNIHTFIRTRVKHDPSRPLSADHLSTPPSVRFSCQTCRQGHASSLLMRQNRSNYVHRHPSSAFLSPWAGQLPSWRGRTHSEGCLSLRRPTFKNKTPHRPDDSSFTPLCLHPDLHPTNLWINWAVYHPPCPHTAASPSHRWNLSPGVCTTSTGGRFRASTQRSTDFTRRGCKTVV